MASALDRIRADTQELHRSLETLPYAEAVLNGSVPIARYASFLRASWVVHTELSAAVERAPLPALRELLGQASERHTLLERDLLHLQTDPSEVDAAALQAAVLGQQMRLAALQSPAQLFGHIYVLEGSQLGNLVQRAALAKRPELQHGGLLYLAGNGARTSADFAQLTSRLEAALTTEADVRAAIEGALAAFTGFAHILGALDPAKPELPAYYAEQLNAEAGTHSVPHDVREVAAALRAGERSYFGVSYYRARYGERGLRYTRSDSAWLVTLSREAEPEQALRQVQWLGRTLAHRGMPHILLEQHLSVLHDALVAALPERAASYRALQSAADSLRGERLGALPRFDALLESYPGDLADERQICAREAATLLLGAVADERRGVAQAVPSLTSWLLDPTRFSPRWIASAHALLKQARAEV